MNTAAITDTRSLKKLLSAAKKCDGKKIKYPVRIICNGSAVVLWNGKEHGFSAVLPCDHNAEADDVSCTAPAADFLSAIVSVKSPFVLSDHRIESGGFSRQLAAYEFTAMNLSHIPEWTATVDAGDLHDALAATLQTVAYNDGSSYRLESVCLESDESGLLNVVSTDSKILTLFPIKNDRQEKFTTLIDRQAAATLAEILPKSGAVTIHADNKLVLIAWTDGQFWTIPTEGRFPRWRDILSSRRNCFSVTANTVTLRTILRPMLSRETSFTIAEGELQAVSELGSATIAVSSPKPFRFKAAASTIAGFLDHVDAETVTIYGEEKPHNNPLTIQDGRSLRMFMPLAE